jgi:hypothetical protein
MRKVVLSLLLFFVGALGCLAQMPRPKPGVSGTGNTADIRDYIGTASFTRTVVVDSALPPGYRQFQTLSAALTYIATQRVASPTLHQYDGSPWLIEMYGGAPGTPTDPSNYIESVNVVVPGLITIQGKNRGGSGFTSAFNGFPVVKLTCPSGSCLKLGGGVSLVDVLLWYKGTPTATGSVVEIDNSGSGSTSSTLLNNVQVSVSPTVTTFAFDGITETAGSLYLSNTGVSMSGGSASSRALVSTDTTSGRGATIYGGRFIGATGCIALIVNAAASGGALQFFGSRIDQKCTTDFVNSGTGPFNVFGTAYASSSGTITDAVVHASSVTLSAGAKVLSAAGAPEGAITAPVSSIYLRADGGTGTSLCVKESGTGNTGWVCK